MTPAGTTRWGSSVAPGDDQLWLIAAAAANEQKLLRGGSWIGDPGDCRSACRSHDEPVIDDDDVFAWLSVCHNVFGPGHPGRQRYNGDRQADLEACFAYHLQHRTYTPFMPALSADAPGTSDVPPSE
jgi:hypothetical protein